MGSIWRTAILGNTALTDNVDIFHGLSNELPIIISKKLKTVVTIHDLFFIRYPHLYQPLEIEILKRRVKHACQIANKIIAINTQTAEDIHSFLGIARNKIEVIYHGCDQCFRLEHDLFELKKTSDLYKLPEDYIVTFTPLESPNGTLSLLKALHTIEDKVDIPLVIVEHPFRSYKKQILEAAKELNLEDRVIFLQNVSRENLSKIYQLSQIFIYTAGYEGSVTRIIEALNAKVPVITSPGFEHVGGKATLYVKNNDHDALGDAITRVLLNAQMAGKMISEGELHARNFDDENVAHQIARVYEGILENQGLTPKTIKKIL